MDKEKIETIKWKLTELAEAEPDFIDSNDFEILGEDEQGRDGYCTVQINSVAEEALALIEQLNNRLLNAFQLVKNGKKIGHLKFDEFSESMDKKYDYNGNKLEI